MLTSFIDYARNKQFKGLAYRYHKRCQWCNRAVRQSQITVDHKISLSHGGTDSLRNLVLSCLSCNNKKAQHSSGEVVGGPADWYTLLEQEGLLGDLGLAIMDREGELVPPPCYVKPKVWVFLVNGRAVYKGTRQQCEQQEKNLLKKSPQANVCVRPFLEWGGRHGEP